MIPKTELGTGNLSTRLLRLRGLVMAVVPVGTGVFLGHNAGELNEGIEKVLGGLSGLCVAVSLGSGRNAEPHAREKVLLETSYQVDVFCNPLLAAASVTALDLAEVVMNAVHGKPLVSGGPAVRCFHLRELTWDYSEESGLLTFSLTFGDYRV